MVPAFHPTGEMIRNQSRAGHQTQQRDYRRDHRQPRWLSWDDWAIRLWRVRVWGVGICVSGFCCGRGFGACFTQMLSNTCCTAFSCIGARGFLVQRHALHHNSAGAENEARYINFATSPLVVVLVFALQRACCPLALTGTA